MVDEKIFHYLNWRIIQSDSGISIDQTEYIQKFLREYFKDAPKLYNIPFHTDSDIEEEIFNSTLCSEYKLI